MYLQASYLMTCKELEKSGFHIQETHVRDKIKQVNRNNVSTPYDESVNV